MKQSGIYRIQSKVKPERVYIGSTVDFTRRRKQHLFSLRARLHSSSKLQRHCDKYGIKDLTFSIIEPVLPAGLISREQYYLDTLHPYFNTRKIADSCIGIPCSEETKQKLRLANTGHRISEEQKQKLRIANLGKKQSVETIEKRASKHRGMKHSMGTREKMRQAAIGRKHTEETKDKLRKINIGKKYIRSEETRIKLSRSLIGNKNCQGRKISREHIEKLRTSLLGNKHYLFRKNQQVKKSA